MSGVFDHVMTYMLMILAMLIHRCKQYLVLPYDKLYTVKDSLELNISIIISEMINALI